MRRFSTILMITINLVGLSMTVIFAAFGLGVIPDDRSAIMTGRGSLCETVAINCVGYARKNEIRALEGMLEAVQERNPAIKSMGVRRTNGDLIVRIGEHPALWSEGKETENSVADQRMHVPINLGRHPWGAIEFCFDQATASGLSNLWKTPVYRFCLFFAAAASVLYFFYLKRALYQLNPARVIPQRVKSAFDAVSEGIVLLDHNARIVMSNQAFRHTMQLTEEELLGRAVSDVAGLQWVNSSWTALSAEKKPPSPWQAVLADHLPRRGDLFEIATDASNRHTFIVNSTPIMDDSKVCRGVIVSLENVTQLQRKQQVLIDLLGKMEISMARIKCQNVALQQLAGRNDAAAKGGIDGSLIAATEPNSEQREEELVSRLLLEIEETMEAGSEHRVPMPHSSIPASRLRRNDSTV